MKILKIAIFSIIIFSQFTPYLYSRDESKKTVVFYTPKDAVGWQAYIVGKVQSFSASYDPNDKRLSRMTEVKNRTIVKLSSREKISVGDELFIIDNLNLVVSRIRVTSIFGSISFGKLLAGRGNFRLASVSYRVVKRKLFDDPELGLRLGDHARGLAVSKYEWTILGRRLSEFYRQHTKL